MKIYGAYVACLVAAIFINIGFASQLKGELATAQRLQTQMMKQAVVFDQQIYALTTEVQKTNESMNRYVAILSLRVDSLISPEQRMLESVNGRLKALERR